jgi:hypothetical protein
MGLKVAYNRVGGQLPEEGQTIDNTEQLIGIQLPQGIGTRIGTDLLTCEGVELIHQHARRALSFAHLARSQFYPGAVWTAPGIESV